MDSNSNSTQQYIEMDTYNTDNEPLVEPTFLSGSLKSANQTDAEKHAPTDSVFPPSRKHAACITCTALIVLISLVATGAFTVGNLYAATQCTTTVAIAETTIFSNTSVDPCLESESVYDMACGGYAYQHQYSNLGDFQALLNAKVKAQLQAEPYASNQAGQFYSKCLAYAKSITENASMYEYFDVDALWMWQRGFSAFDITFGRTTNPASSLESIVYIANKTFFKSYHEQVLPTVVYSTGSVCEQRIVQLARMVVNQMISTVVLYSNDIEILCELAEEWLGTSNKTTLQDQTFTVRNMFESSNDCLQTTTLLWSGLVNDMVNAVNTHATDDSKVLALCFEVQSAYVAMLLANNYDSVAAKIQSVECSTSINNVYTVYDTGDYTNLSFVDYASLLLWQHFDQSVASSSIVKGMFDMSAIEVNAVYSPLNNKLLITPAMVMFSASMSERRAFALGRIGFVLAHELSHAIDNKGIYFDTNGMYTADSIVPSDQRKQLNTSFQCLADRFGNNKLTLQEDIADHLAMSVVNDMMEKSKIESDIHICAPTCKTLTGMQQFYIHFAQSWCSSSSYNSLSASSHDVHSSPRQRVDHTLKHVDALSAFKCPQQKDTTNCFIYDM